MKSEPLISHYLKEQQSYNANSDFEVRHHQLLFFVMIEFFICQNNIKGFFTWQWEKSKKIFVFERIYFVLHISILEKNTFILSRCAMTQEIPQVSSKILRVLENRGFGASAKWSLAGSAGSGRRYFRIAEGENSAILQTNLLKGEDFDRFVSYGKSFSAFGFPTPEIWTVDEEALQVLMQDMGTNTLYSLVMQNGELLVGNVRILYPLAIEALVKWQHSSPRFFLSRPDIAARRFDYAALKWESDYFRENFLQKEKGIFEIPAAVENFFSTLACMVDTHPKVLMHRDFQSQNVTVQSDSEIGFVDFQGARRGSVFYDIASLLLDPYVSLSENLVTEFFDEWYRNNSLCSSSFDREEAWVLFLQAGMQRLMQALGAFCFLSREKKIESFGKFIVPGCRRLLRILELYESISPSRHEAIAFLKESLS